MRSKVKSFSLSILTSLALITACQPVNINTDSKQTNNILNSKLETKTTIKGTAEFPNFFPFSNKATLADIGTNATVSLIYPSDYSDSSLRNVTIATGLTNLSGQFIINLSNSFNPQIGQIFVLEAIKRMGSASISVMTVRTFIRWNGSNWDSITTPGIFINTKTTALTVIVDLNSSILTSVDTINKISIVNGSSSLQDINANVTVSVITDVASLVSYLILNNRDPVENIKYDTSVLKYVINNPFPLIGPTPIPTNQTSQNIYTIAGGGDKDNVQATSSFLFYPSAVSIDNNGNIFIADKNNHRIKKVDYLTGIISTVAGNGTSSGYGNQATNASISSPSGVAVDNDGNIYISDTGHNIISKVNLSTGIISTVVGNGGPHRFSGDGGQATSASLNKPTSIAIDTNRNIFFVDSLNFRIRKVDSSTGIITTVAGTDFGLTGDGIQATSTSLGIPSGVEVDNNGNIYISDPYEIRKVDALTGIITTVAGNGSLGFSGDGVQATNTSLNYPSGLSVDSIGNIFIADSNNNRIRKVNASTGIITTVSGNDMVDFSGDGGLATNASLNKPSGVRINASGNVFIADTGNNRVRKVDAITGVITTVAGMNNGDGGQSSNASLYHPLGVTSNGNIFIADSGNNRIRKIDALTGVITTVAGNGAKGYSGDGGLATNTSLNNPSGVALDNYWNIFIADYYNHRIRKVDAITGVITTVAGNGGYGFSGDEGQATNASLNYPYGIIIDSSGNLFIADKSNNRIRKVDAITGVITTVAGNGSTGYSGDGGQATSASLYWPSGVAFDNTGNIFISEYNNKRIRKVNVSTGIITTVAGNGSYGFSGDGSLATNASLDFPSGVALDSMGNIFIADNGNNRIRKVNASTSIITSIAGNNTTGYSGDGGQATSASLYWPSGVAFDSSGNIFIVDTNNNRIRKVVP